MSKGLMQNKDSLLDDSLDENILGLVLYNIRQKESYLKIFQIIFFLFGFFLITNTIVLYGFVYGTYRTVEDLLQLFLFFLGLGLIRLTFLFRQYSKESKVFYEKQDTVSFRKLMELDLRVWKMASVVTLLFFFSIIIAVFFVGILDLDSAFWIFLQD